MDTKYLIAVVGPTAVGKTEVAIQLAQYFRTEILSADSRQFYQGIPIGTSQPTTQQLATVPHHFVNFLPIQATYSAGIFEKEALHKLEDLFKTHTYVVLTGGSGLYLKAVCEGFDDLPAENDLLRQQLNLRLQQNGLAELRTELAALDPSYYLKVDLNNPIRILRALEVCLTTGQPYSSFRNKQPTHRVFKCIKIGLFKDRPVLYQQIDQRVDKMFAQGLLEEATAFCEYKDCNALQTIGYRELFGYLGGDYDLTEAIRRIKRNTRRYAKRQLIWFNQVADIHWVQPVDFEGIINYINKQTSAQ